MLDIVTGLLADLPTQQVRWSRPVLIGIMGLPGTGKTEIANYLAERHPLVKLSTDSIRLKYGLASGPATHDVMYQVAGKLLPKKASLILDGIHLGKRDRDRVRRVADEYGAYAAIIYATASPDIIEERLQQRLQQSQQATDDKYVVITPEHFAVIASYLEAPSDDEELYVVDTSQGTIEGQLSGLERQLRQLLTGLHL
jgi:predicted kinase